MAFSALAALLGAAFAVVVGQRWRRTRRPAFAAWTAGLLVFAAAAATQAAGEAGGFSVALFRAFYLLGGVLGVVYLALGTLFLLAPARLARVAAIALVALTVLLAVDAALIPVDSSRLHDTKGVLGEALAGHGNPLYVAAVLFNIAGTLVLVGGSAWSGWRFFRDGAGVDRVLCNALLTAGALVIAAGFSAAKLRADTAGGLSILGACEAVGIATMFAGFLSLGRVGVGRGAFARSSSATSGAAKRVP